MTITSVLNLAPKYGLNLAPNKQKIKIESIIAGLSYNNNRLAWSDPGPTVLTSGVPRQNFV